LQLCCHCRRRLLTLVSSCAQDWPLASPALRLVLKPSGSLTLSLQADWPIRATSHTVPVPHSISTSISATSSEPTTNKYQPRTRKRLDLHSDIETTHVSRSIPSCPVLCYRTSLATYYLSFLDSTLAPSRFLFIITILLAPPHLPPSIHLLATSSPGDQDKHQLRTRATNTNTPVFGGCHRASVAPPPTTT
jgi:hypothetical protein